jgi:hypothetical protein
MTESIRFASGESSPVKTRCSLRNSTRTPFFQPLHQRSEVIQVPGESVHAAHHQGVAVPDEAQELLELGALDVLARGFVGEDPVQLNALELAHGVLVQAADPDISDALPGHGAFLYKECQVEP